MTQLDDLLLVGRFAEVDLYLDALLNTLPMLLRDHPALLMGALTVTLGAREHLPNRTRLFEEARGQALLSRPLADVEQIFSGLA